MTSPVIGYLYPSGWGNLGDEAIQRAAIASIRAVWPRARIRAFTLNPVGTRRHHDVEAEPITGISLRFSPVLVPDEPWPCGLITHTVDRIRRPWALHLALRKVEAILKNLLLEVRSVARAWRWLGHAHLLVVPGGGQLDALWGGAWGHPWALARWAFLARRARVPMVILSVGYGRAEGRLARVFLRYVLRRALYCSLRDEGSLELARALNPGGDLRVAPDLAFGLRRSEGEPDVRESHAIGLGPMAFHRRSWPVHDAQRYRALLDLYARFVSQRAARGDRIHLFTTDPSDEAAVDDVLARLDETARGACIRENVDSVDALLSLFARLEVVVGTRLHAIVLALVAERPAVALSYERKVGTMMAAAGLSEACFDWEETGLEVVHDAVDHVLREQDSIRSTIRARLAIWRSELDLQAERYREWVPSQFP